MRYRVFVAPWVVGEGYRFRYLAATLDKVIDEVSWWKSLDSADRYAFGAGSVRVSVEDMKRKVVSEACIELG